MPYVPSVATGTSESAPLTDPSAVQALLEQLRTSQAWQQAITQPQPEQEPPEVPVSDTSDAGASHSVASLLSQLKQPSGWPTTAPVPSEPFREPTSQQYRTKSFSALQEPSVPHIDVTTPPMPAAIPQRASTSPNPELKSYSFLQALPILAQMSENRDFVDALVKLKGDQDELERRLWNERASIRKKYEDKVKVARTKANMIGAGLSKHDADMMSTAYKNELRKFDLERVLPAWDGLLSNQQTALASLGVPTMFATTAKATRERQQKVMQVLEGLL
ncbi:hypothetical protein PC9H_005057 [Pleurotus ostreatus]|uniref:Uncharacterized protein n=1 Tax=Pleurotus ostreatus TaxID=5322 RepID=A0A8H6ZYC8_PLEOS|nr:uncharacterized protein PC9H_005057 [Pleurotus ostreatus]KAF7433109.1 hypothetical protein PC9H_005057 [Pleurotus ostreatus]